VRDKRTVRARKLSHPTGRSWYAHLRARPTLRAARARSAEGTTEEEPARFRRYKGDKGAISKGRKRILEAGKKTLREVPGGRILIKGCEIGIV